MSQKSSLLQPAKSVSWMPTLDNSTHAAAYNAFNVQRHLTSGKTHRAFRASAMQTGAKSSLRRERDVPADSLRALFGNVTVPRRAMAQSRHHHGVGSATA